MIFKSNNYTSMDTWEAIWDKQPRVGRWKLIDLVVLYYSKACMHAFVRVVTGDKKLSPNRRINAEVEL